HCPSLPSPLSLHDALPIFPNWVDYEDIEGANITLDPEGWVPSTDAPLIIRVNSPTDTIGPVNIQGWSANNDREQDYSRYILLDASQATRSEERRVGKR